MADAWLKIQPNSGKGNLQISVSSLTPHTGRVQRQTIAQGRVSNDTSKIIELTVLQSPKPHFFQFISGPTELTYIAQTVSNIKFKTNAQGIHRGTGANNIKILHNNISRSIPYNFIGDPGAISEFEFEITADIPINDTLNDINITITLVTSQGDPASYIVTQHGITTGIASMTIGTDFIIR